MMNFAQPLWLAAGLFAVIGLAFFFRILEKQRLAALERFVAHQLIGRLTGNISTARRRTKNLLLLLAVLLAFAALARPQYGEQWVDVKRRGIDLLFALDTSKSMLAEDVKPNRLQRARLAILDFVRQQGGDRVGLMPFAGTAYLMCPLTLDYDAFEQSLTSVNTDLIPRGGTNLAAVIDRAMEVLDNASNHKILIIVTDGENVEGEALAAAEKAAAGGLTIHTVGVGTAQGELIPLAGGRGQSFVKDQSGNFVTSKLDEATLTAIADKSGGLYAPLGAGEGLEAIYQRKLALIPKEELAERRHKVPIERFEWPLAFAALVLVAEMLIGERKKTRSFSLGELFRRRLSRKGRTLFLLLLLMPLATRSYGSEGEDAYRRGDFLAASEYYGKLLEKSPNDAQLQYNYGTAAYKNHLYDEAVEAFTKALRSEEIELQQKAYFNRGNSQYQKGAEMRLADPKAAAEQWRQAIASLQSVLELNPSDENAKHNKEIVEQQLARLEKELKEQKQQTEGEKQQDDRQQDGGEDQDNGEQQQPEQGTSRKENSPVDKSEDTAAGKQGGDEAKPPATPGGEGENKDDAEAKTETGEQPPAPAEQADRQEPTPAEQAAKDAERRQLGKMTREEAERMLNALKQEEGELNFVPSRGTMNDKTDKDW